MTMVNESFRQLRRHVFELYRSGRYSEALKAAEEAYRRFPTKLGETAYWLACLRCLLDRPEEALQILQEALEAGHWWGERPLLQDPDLKALQDRQEFQAIVAESKRRWEAAQAQAKPELLVLTPKSFKQTQKEALPLLFALHGYGGNAEEFAPFWEEALQEGFVAALPQSSQVCKEDGFCWDDAVKAEKELAAHWETLNRSYTIDHERVILAGASQGGTLAIKLSLRGKPFSSRGFIAVIPAIRDAKALASVADLNLATERGVRGWLFIGELDQGFRGETERFHALAKERSFPCELVIEPRLGHDFPEEFGSKLARALNFILENS